MSPVRAKDALGAFLRSRREALRPEDIGLRRGPHRRVGGLRREEVAELCGISADYVGRLERGTGPWPSSEVLGDETAYRGLARSAGYRWFLDPAGRDLYPARDHAANSRIQASLLRESLVRYGDGSFTAQVVAALLDQSDEFRSVWDRQEAGLRFPPEKHFEHPEVGGLELYCQTLVDGGSGQFLLVFTAAPGSESYGRLALLNVMGRQLLEAPAGSRPSS